MKITASGTPNIALIKYWGNRHEALRLPAADSLSMTLDSPSVTVSIEPTEVFSVRSTHQDGTVRMMNMKELERLKKHFQSVQEYLQTLGVSEMLPKQCAMHIQSNVPSGIGLASSAAVFAALAEAYAGFTLPKRSLTRAEISVLARLGSGSACRSVLGGFVAMEVGKGDAIDSAKAIQIAPENHWQLHDIIIAPTMSEKKVGSSEGHTLAATSPFFLERIDAIMQHRQRACIDAILKRDFEILQKVAEEDALDMHRVMETSVPPLQYLSDQTYTILEEILSLRQKKHLPVLYTMDAGPTVHLICTDEALLDVREFSLSQKNNKIFEAKIGRSSHLLQ